MCIESTTQALPTLQHFRNFLRNGCDEHGCIEWSIRSTCGIVCCSLHGHHTGKLTVFSAVCWHQWWLHKSYSRKLWKHWSRIASRSLINSRFRYNNICFIRVQVNDRKHLLYRNWLVRAIDVVIITDIQFIKQFIGHLDCFGDVFHTSSKRIDQLNHMQFASKLGCPLLALQRNLLTLAPIQMTSNPHLLDGIL